MFQGRLQKLKIKAIDIAYVQHNVDFKKVKQSGIKAVIIRTGYLNKTDTEFHNHMKGAIKAGLDIGVYTYIMSDTVAQAKLEAQQTVERLKDYRGHVNYPVFCDMESEKYYNKAKYSNRLRTDIIKTFCEEIKKAGYYAALYINPAWLDNWTFKEELIGTYDIWLAAWTDDPNKPTKYDYSQTMWQWGKGPVAGINGKVDGDLVYVNYPAKIRELDKNFLPKGEITRRASHDVVKSYGQAAIRTSPQKLDDNILRRCEKSTDKKEVLYTIDANITVDGVKWLSHAGEIGYSMLMDGSYLFKKVGSYEERVAATKVNVRSAPKIALGNILGVLNAGDIVCVMGASENGWFPCVYKNQKAYVSAQYVKEG